MIAVFWVSMAAWAALEVGLVLRDRLAGITDHTRDRGSGPFLVLLVGVAILIDLALSRAPDRALAFHGTALFDAGIACIWAGLALRLWAVATLGRFFRLVVLLQDGHRVISDGPYRVIRHPAYTGTLLTMLGLGLTLDSWVGLVACLVLPLVGYARRITVEEAAMRDTLGPEYVAYARRTRRLVPLVW